MVDEKDCHDNRIRYKDSGQFVLISVVNYNTRDYIPDYKESVSNT